MIENQSLRLDQLLSLTWGKLMMQKHYQAAAALATLGYFLGRETQDEVLQRTSNSILLKATDEMRSTEATKIGDPTPSCSFCGRVEPEVRLGAGPNAFICDSCVETFHDIFFKGPGS